jgi:biotin carboxyl carrier protein
MPTTVYRPPDGHGRHGFGLRGPQPGQVLQTNDLMMVLEAMKTEANITAPVTGKIKGITVGQGEGVQVNWVLVEFE